MTEPTLDGQKELFYLAFDLAYFIHASKDLAFFVAEDALEGLSTLLGHQKKSRMPPETLRGFWKWGERTRPIRKGLVLNEKQMLQWLVYKESQKWELETENGRGLYAPSEEDLIIRYVEYLVFNTVRRGSFYVTLAICSLLHQFDRRETRLFYDVLTQSDSARMKDTNYIGKQRLELLDRVARRFDGRLQTVKRSGEEKQFLMRPATEWIISLVTQSLNRFAPWGTSCLLEPGFDVTDIPSLYFSETGEESEDSIELNRIHAVLDPACLNRFSRGLSEYVKSLTPEDPDSRCNFDSVNERIALPQYSDFEAGPPRGDRFQTPKLAVADYIRLQRTLDARARRKKSFVPEHLQVYVDGVCSYSFNPEHRNGRFIIAAGASCVELRGQNPTGDVLLATVVLDYSLHAHEKLASSIVQPGGHRVWVNLTVIVDERESITAFNLEISYRHRNFARTPGAREALIAVKDVRNRLRLRSPIYVKGIGPIKIAAIAATIIILLTIGWRQFFRPPVLEPQVPSEALKNKPHEEPSLASPTPMSAATSAVAANVDIARARWVKDRRLVLGALSVEPTRGEPPTFELPARRSKVTLSLPIYDDQGRRYLQYRVTIFTKKKSLWRRTLRAPRASLADYSHVLDIALNTSRLSRGRIYAVRVEGGTQHNWRSIGNVKIKL